VNRYLLTTPANEDLLEIFEYTLRKWGEEQVHVYAAQLDTAFAQLAENPLRPGSKSADNLAEGCRLFKVAHHVIAYRPEADFLLIARILHETMDFEPNLTENHFTET
jgi:toxin ParE1/3/4